MGSGIMILKIFKFIGYFIAFWMLLGLVLLLFGKLNWEYGYHLNKIEDSLKVVILPEIIDLDESDIIKSNASVSSDSTVLFFSGGIGDSIAYLLLKRRKSAYIENIVQKNVDYGPFFPGVVGLENRFFVFLGIKSSSAIDTIAIISEIDKIVKTKDASIYITKFKKEIRIGGTEDQMIFRLRCTDDRNILAFIFNHKFTTTVIALNKVTQFDFTDRDIDKLIGLLNIEEQ